MKRVAIIGGGVAGLTSATLLARQGHDVTLFEAMKQLGGKASRVEHRGIVLDAGPTLLTMPEVVRATFAALGATDLLPELIRLPLQCRYHFANGRTFDVFEDLAATEQSVAQLSADEAAALKPFYAEAEAIYRTAGEPYLSKPFLGVVEFIRRMAPRSLSSAAATAVLGTMSSFAARHFRTPELRQFVGRFATYAGASPFKASATFAMIPHVERAFGVHHVKGGMGALSAALEQAARRSGVRIHTGSFATRSRSALGGFLVGPVGGEERFDSVVVNADPLATGGVAREAVTMSGYVLLVAAQQRLALPHHTILFSRSEREEFEALFGGGLPEDLTLYLCHPAASDPLMAPAGQSGLYLMVNAPAGYFEPQERLRELCLRKLRALCPGVAFEVIGERTPADFARLGGPLGSLYGFLPHGRLAPLRRPRMQGQERGLFFCGGGTHPGGGVPLVMLSGRFAASMADAHLRGVA